jgi:hypothetical protein
MMDDVTKTHHPSKLLHQVAWDMNFRHPEISVTVPRVTTWKTVLRAIGSALREVDGPIMILDKCSESQRQRRQQILRQVALQTVKQTHHPDFQYALNTIQNLFPFQSQHPKRHGSGSRSMRSRTTISTTRTPSPSTRRSRRKHYLS